jgi:hypothetical protein
MARAVDVFQGLSYARLGFGGDVASQRGARVPT